MKIERRELSAYTSTLTWDEVVWVVSRALGRNDSVDEGRELLGFPNIEFIDVDQHTLSTAQTLLEKSGLTPRDSIHLASAINKKNKPDNQR